MNREIKFRIWDVENKEMLKVQELDFESTFYGGRIAIRPDQYNDYFDTEDMILMQYTGLHDKNGKEIYEGDIVLYEDWEMAYEGGGNDSFINKGIVEYCEDNCCYNVTERQTVDITDVLYKDNEDLEVIGNIYDNPELLGGE